MAGRTNGPDADSATISSWSSTGAATPSTDVDETYSAIEEWLRPQRAIGYLAPAIVENTAERFGPLEVTQRADPITGNVYLILDRSRDRVLKCDGGDLRFHDIHAIGPETPIEACWKWLCTEKDGFKGFKNIGNGGFLGHDIWWDFYAKVPHHEGWECFTCCRQEDGLYWIQALNWWTQWQVCAREDGYGLFSQQQGGTPWEFVKILE